MRSFKLNIKRLFLAASFLLALTAAWGQEQQQEQKKKPKPVKYTFNSGLLADHHTVMVPVKKTLTLDIMHRFGLWKKGYEDFFGLFASSNIRIGASYTPVNNLELGLGFTKANMLWDAEAKYALIRQAKGAWPVSISYLASVEVDTRKKENFIYTTDRFSYFHQLLIARKFSDKFSMQIASSITHVNSVNSYYGANSKVKQEMKHEHVAIALTTRYKIKETMAVFFNYDQPITKHNTNNPHPNLQLGIEMTTSAHSFQFFAGNYYALSQVRNNMFNKNDYTKGEYLIGFNISRLWNY